MLIVINYADSKFEDARKINTKTAYSTGKADKVFSFSPEDIEKDFFEKNRNILSQKRGAGLWLWKPYFIFKTLRELKKGDYLFYCDSGAHFVNNIHLLIPALEKSNQSIMGYEIPLLERQYTKKETFILMNYVDSNYNQIAATYILFKVSSFSIQFVQEWLSYSCDERILSPEYFCSNIIESNDFIAHREDQSIFSILYHKYNLKSFKDPSQYGVWTWEFKMPDRIYSPITDFETDSNYPVIIALRRRTPYKRFKRNFFLKKVLHHLGLYKFIFTIKYKLRYKINYRNNE